MSTLSKGPLSETLDEDLILAYFKGDNASLLELFARYMTVIDKKISTYSYLQAETEDLKQEALITFLDAVRGYDPGAGVRFRTYVSRCLDNSVKNSLAKLNTRKAKMLSGAVSIDTSPEKDILQVLHNNPEQMYIDKEKYERLLSLIETSLTCFEKDVLFCYLDGSTYDAIALKLDSSSKAVDNALQRVRKKLKGLF